MFPLRPRGFAAAALCALVLSLTTPVHAQSLVNGDFEASLTGWTVVNQVGSSGDWYAQSGVLSPESGSSVPAPPQGVVAAMTDQSGPGSHVLYQDFLVPAGPIASAAISFQLFIQNQSPDFIVPDPASLDFTTEANQQARVDIITTTADPFSTAAGDVLLNIYQTNPGDPLVSGYSPVSADLTAFLNMHLGETLRLRFAEADNQLFFQMGVDDVVLRSPDAPVPEPSTALVIGLGTAFIAVRRRFRAGSRR